MPPRLASLLPAVAALTLALSAVAHAAPTKAEARKHYDAGRAAYADGRYDPALTEFEAGYAIAPQSSWLYYMGEAARLARKPDKARDYYRRYITENPSGSQREDAERRLLAVEAELSQQKAAPKRNLVLNSVGEVEEADPPAGAGTAPTKAPGATTGAPKGAGTDGKPAADPSALSPYELGLRLRGIFVTRDMLAPYLDAATSMESVAVGVEFGYLREKFDVVTSIDFSWLAVHDGNYLAKGHDPSLDTKYIQFPNLSFLSVDVALIGHTDIGKYLQIRYGGGIGIGAVLGDVYVTDNTVGCGNVKAAQDVTQCTPWDAQKGKGVDLKQPQATLNPLLDAAGRHLSGDKPPVMAVANLLVGARFKITPHLSAQVELGFRDAIFAGAGAHWRF